MLRGDGLGVVSFGDAMDDAMATLTDLLGPPSGERVYEAPWDEAVTCWTATGTTCIDYLRIASWDTIGLVALFSDWTKSAPDSAGWEPTQAPPNLRGYEYWGGVAEPVLTTENGVTIGATVDDLAKAYGEAVRYSYDECAFNVAGFDVIAPADQAGPNSNSGVNWGLWGEFSGLPDSPDTVVTSIGAGSLLGGC